MIPFKLIAILLLIGLSLPVFSQDKTDLYNYAVRGMVLDTVVKSKMANTSIIILSRKDSIIQDFIRTPANGNFSIAGLDTGKYILLATYPGYADYAEEFELKSTQKIHDFGTIKMILKSNLLHEVVIQGTVSAIKIKGDTTEYNAKAYKLNANAKVEDLLKQLPGIQIDKDGRITAQGQSVNKVLVDGEEFFGDDPTLVTKNIRADMVDKVQLYDKKSDRATFTGIDDGKRSKTINVTLKEDKKNGYFGKLEAGIGTDGYYKGQALYNLFKSKQKFSAYSIVGNDGKTSLDWQDNAKYASSNLDMSSMGSIIDLGGYDELESFSGKYNGQGSPLARTGGLHYDNKWNNDKQYINSNFKIGSLSVDGTDQSETQNNLPTGIITSSSNKDFHNHIFRQKLDVGYQTKLNLTEDLKININGSLKNTQKQSNYISTSYTANTILLNSNNVVINNNGEKDTYFINALYTKKFKKTGRTLAVYLTETANKGNTKGYLNSKINFYDKTGPLASIQKIDQYKINAINEQIFNANITYTEPIFKRLSVLLNYGLGLDNSNSNRQSFNQSTTGKYDLLDSLYSNDFKLKQLSNQFGAVFNFNAKKTIINAGANGSFVNFQQLDGYTNNLFKRNFFLLNPQANYQYQFSQQSSFRFNYTGNATAPNFAQLQPVLINNDPLNITIGNPNLKPSFTNNYSVSYQIYNVVSNQNFAFFGRYSSTVNPIVGNIFTDSTGKSTFRYINLNSHAQSNLNLSFFYDAKIKALKMDAGINFNVGGNTNYYFSNDALNRIDSYTYSLQARFSKFVKNKYDFNVSLGPNYTFSGSSLQQQINNNGRGFTGNGDFTIHLPGKLQFASNATYQYNAKTETFNTDFSKLILNSSLSKTFSKAENLKLSLSGNDLLNQNTGFSRNIGNNLISQNSYSTIRRYFMISMTYDFNKTIKSTTNK